MSGLGVLTQIVQDARETVRVSLFTIGVNRKPLFYTREVDIYSSSGSTPRPHQQRRTLPLVPKQPYPLHSRNTSIHMLSGFYSTLPPGQKSILTQAHTHSMLGCLFSIDIITCVY